MVETSGNGVRIERHFSRNGVYDVVEWGKYDIDIIDEKGQVIFTQRGTEFPQTWSGLAMKIVASKYFYGDFSTGERESSAKQLIDRVTSTIADWGLKDKRFNRATYFDSREEADIFRDELAALVLQQKISFNSPVWFNVGVHRYTKGRKDEVKRAYIIDDNGNIVPLPPGTEYEYPQTAACFIQWVDDTMESISELATNEAMVFKYGSGTGTDLSTLRSSREKLRGGGKPSGPKAYLRYMDVQAGVVKSGGKTRRAAKMDSLRTEHPDIREFIETKKKEQEKLEVLMDYFASKGLSKEEAYALAEETVSYQNTNLSVRATDDFMQAALDGDDWQTIPVHNKELAEQMPRYNASDLLDLIAEGTHACGDPGMQFHTTINRWHTCPESGTIEASNPCSEYMFLNDSACNLASLNLVAFWNPEKGFDVEGFKRASKLTAKAQEILISNSSYPTEKIARNAHDYRPLGQGYANLGGLLMRLGLPYDSDEGRAVAATITALQTASVYEASVEMAKRIGAFQEFEKNKKPMLNVIKMHRNSTDKINDNDLPLEFRVVKEEARKTFDRDIAEGEVDGFRNAQATVLAPTGTISFMMDCDTTGIEPDLALKKTKLLAGGGVLKIVNQAISPALIRLDYSSETRDRILAYAMEHGTLEGSELKSEHLAVFDCSFKLPEVERFIHYSGHLKMMAAVQPFLSGGISKTVNMPGDATVQDIRQAYIDAWKMGLKAVAIYRDGSKRRQPLSPDAKKELERKVETKTTKPSRRKLPTTRPSITHKFEIYGGHEGYITSGIYPDDGTIGETFITMAKEGSLVSGLMDAFATSISLNLQHGVPLRDLVRKFRNMRFEPSGRIVEGHPNIKEAKSVVDYIFTYLAEQFPEQAGLLEDKKMRETVEKVIKEGDEENRKNRKFTALVEEPSGNFCVVCSSAMLRKGSCLEICSNKDCRMPDPRGCTGGK